MSADTAPDPTPTPQRSFGTVLRNRAFLRLWLAQAITQTSQQMINFILLVQVRYLVEERELASGNTVVALLILCFATPPILFSALAGVMVDRSEKRLVMTLVNIGRGCCIAGYLLLQPTWPLLTTLLYIYLLCFSFSTIGQLFGPAEGSAIPQLVGRDLLLSANALFSLTYLGSQLLGFVILGPILTHLLRPTTIYLLVAGLYGFSALLIASLPRLPRPDRSSGQAATRTIRSDLQEVLAYLRQTPILRKAITYLTIANSTFLLLAALAPEFVATTLDLPPERLIVIIGPAGVGMGLGVLIVGRLGYRLNRERFIDRSLLVVGGLLLLFTVVPTLLATDLPATEGTALTPAVLTAMVLAFGLGVTNACILVPSQTLLQERSTEQNRARVLASFFTISNTFALLPILFAGVLGDLFGVVLVLIAIALLILLAGITTEWRYQQRRLRAP